MAGASSLIAACTLHGQSAEMESDLQRPAYNGLPPGNAGLDSGGSQLENQSIVDCSELHFRI